MKQRIYSTFAILFGLVSTLFFVNAGKVESAPTSNKKFAVLKQHSHDRAPANFNKARAPLSTSVARIDDSSDQNFIRLQGTVKAARAFQNLKVIWSVPSEVEVVSGSMESSFSLAAGQSQTFEVLVKSKTPQNRQIHFSVQTTDRPQGDNYGSSAQYNTTRQEVIAKQLKENFLKAREQVRAGELRKIIF